MTVAGLARAAPPPPRLDLVSPLPPVRSGIADYSRDLLPHLAALADVRLIRMPGQPVAPELAAAWPLAGPEEAGEEAAGELRLPLYQMGNNRHHEGVLELALRLPGVLTLHDVVLHHLLLDVTLGREDFYGYKERLTRDHGWVGEAVAVAKRWGAYGTAPIFALPAHRTLLRRQRGVLVHSEWAAAVVREDDPQLRVRAVPMGVPLPAAADPGAGLAMRRRLGLPEDAPVLGSFGFQTPIKRTDLAVRALAAPGLERVHLLVVGEEATGTGLLAAARGAGVAARVHLAGYLPFGDFAAAIAAADLCLNLRYPTAGETSASLLRVMAAGRPAMVSEYAQFAELPDAIAIKVPLAGGDEAALLAARLTALLAQPQRLLAMGDAAREHVRRRHDPRRAAAAVVAACREWAAAPPLDDPRTAREGAAGAAATGAEPPRPSSLTWGRLAGDLEVRGAELPWPEGERRRLEVVLRNRGFARWLAGDRGPGGIALVVKLIAEGRDLLAGRPWLPLPRDLAPGEEVRLELDVRRPPGPPAPPWPAGVTRMPLAPDRVRLWIEPHLFGGLGLSHLGGPRWERDL
jgi:glycosyltransferase involved in cell wall biosynthesis